MSAQVRRSLSPNLSQPASYLEKRARAKSQGVREWLQPVAQDSNPAGGSGSHEGAVFWLLASFLVSFLRSAEVAFGLLFAGVSLMDGPHAGILCHGAAACHAATEQ